MKQKLQRISVKTNQELITVVTVLNPKLTKINKPLFRLTRKKKMRSQITITRNERDGITTDPTNIKSIIREYSE